MDNNNIQDRIVKATIFGVILASVVVLCATYNEARSLAQKAHTSDILISRLESECINKDCYVRYLERRVAKLESDAEDCVSSQIYSGFKNIVKRVVTII